MSKAADMWSLSMLHNLPVPLESPLGSIHGVELLYWSFAYKLLLRLMYLGSTDHAEVSRQPLNAPGTQVFTQDLNVCVIRYFNAKRYSSACDARDCVSLSDRTGWEAKSSYLIGKDRKLLVHQGRSVKGCWSFLLVKFYALVYSWVPWRSGA